MRELNRGIYVFFRHFLGSRSLRTKFINFTSFQPYFSLTSHEFVVHNGSRLARALEALIILLSSVLYDTCEYC